MSDPEHSQVEDEALTLAFSVRSSPGAYALLLGAGVSSPSGVPTAWEVLEDLTGQVAEIARDERPDDPIQWFESEYGEPPTYESILERLAPTRLERQRLLRGFFEPSPQELDEGKKKETLAHSAIADLVKSGKVRIILTLNFDRLMERALRKVGVEPTVASSPAEIAGLGPLHTLECCVVHLHGDYLTPTSMLNTTSELESYDPPTEHFLQRVLEDYGLVVAGWSAEYDPALRSAIDRFYSTRSTLAWIEPNPQSDAANELRKRKNGQLLRVDADTGFSWLSDAVASLDKIEARHPLTVPVAIETAKRDLGREGTAIDLHDTLAREFARLDELPEFHLTDHHDPNQKGGFEAMVARVDEATRICCAFVATLGYWGNESTDAWWIDEIERFSRVPHEGGEVRLLSLRMIAGSLLFYSAGISAVAGRRFDLLARLLRLDRENPFNSEPELLADALAADNVYVGLEGPNARLDAVLVPILETVLSYGSDQLDSARQTFEVVRLAQVLRTDGRFGAAAAKVIEQNEEIRQLRNKVRSGVATETDIKDRETEAIRKKRQGLSDLSDFVDTGRPHVLASDRGSDERWRSPVARKLIDSLEGEGDSHPMIEAGFGRGGSQTFIVALEAVNVALGRLGDQVAHAHLKPGTAEFIPYEVWLDSGEWA